MAKSSSLGQLAGLLVISVLVLATAGLFGVWSAHRQAEDALSQANHLTSLTDASRKAQVDFKTQVQMWKNLLLRGQRSEQFQNYRDKLLTQEEKVQNDIAEIEKAGELPTDIVSEITQIQVDHAAVNQAYAQGAALYVVGDPTSIFRVDASVKGVDQALNERFDRLAERLAAHRTDELLKLTELGNQQYRTLSTITGIIGGIAALVAIVVAWKATRTAM